MHQSCGMKPDITDPPRRVTYGHPVVLSRWGVQRILGTWLSYGSGTKHIPLPSQLSSLTSEQPREHVSEPWPCYNEDGLIVSGFVQYTGAGFGFWSFYVRWLWLRYPLPLCRYTSWCRWLYCTSLKSYELEKIYVNKNIRHSVFNKTLLKLVK